MAKAPIKKRSFFSLIEIAIGIAMMAIPIPSAWAGGYEIEFSTQSPNPAALSPQAPPTMPPTSTDPNRNQGPSWSPFVVATGKPNTPEFSRAHQRANEINTLITSYILDKINQIQSISQHETTDDVRRSDLKRLKLGDFCHPGENGDDCGDRYILGQKPVLYRLQKGMVVNSDAETRLKCVELEPNGRCKTPEKRIAIRSDWGDGSQNKPEVFVPFFPTYRELQVYSRIMQQERPITQVDYTQWINQFAPEPRLEDFVLFKTIPRDPTSPTGEEFTVLVRDASGQPQYDAKAFEISRTEWQKNRAAILGHQNEMRNNLPSTQHLKTSRDQFALDSNPETSANADDYQDYANSRGRLVDAAKKLIQDPTRGKSQGSKSAVVKKDPASFRSMPSMPGMPPSTSAVPTNDPPPASYTGHETLDPAALMQRSAQTGEGSTNQFHIYLDPNLVTPQNLENPQSKPMDPPRRHHRHPGSGSNPSSNPPSNSQAPPASPPLPDGVQDLLSSP